MQEFSQRAKAQTLMKRSSALPAINGFLTDQTAAEPIEGVFR